MHMRIPDDVLAQSLSARSQQGNQAPFFVHHYSKECRRFEHRSLFVSATLGQQKVVLSHSHNSRVSFS
jgi:hypothetical protein